MSKRKRRVVTPAKPTEVEAPEVIESEDPSVDIEDESVEAVEEETPVDENADIDEADEVQDEETIPDEAEESVVVEASVDEPTDDEGTPDVEDAPAPTDPKADSETDREEHDPDPEATAEETAPVVEEDVVEDEIVQPEVDGATVENTEREALVASLEGQLLIRELEEYTDKALKTFKETGERVPLSPRKNYRESRTRSLDPKQWSVAELMDWLDGHIVAHSSVSDETILDEIFFRWKIPNHYTLEDAKVFVRDGTLAPSTHHGIPLKDRRREATPLVDLTYAELCSIYLGDIESKFSKSEVKRRIMLIARILDEDRFEAQMQKFKEGGGNMNDLTDQLIGVLEQRKELYRRYGDRLDDAKLATNTKVFYNVLRRVTKADYAAFSEAWRTMLKHVDNNYTGIFHPSQIRRGWPMVELSPGNMTILDRLLVLIVGTRNPSTRRTDARGFQLEYVLEPLTNQKERDNILTFYNE